MNHTAPSALGWLFVLAAASLFSCARPVIDADADPPKRPTAPSQGQNGTDPTVPGGPTGGLPCTPCETSADCGGPDDLCIINSLEGASFCSTACQSEVDCPKSFLCVPIQGANANQCIPDSGSCEGYDPEPSTPDPTPEPDPGTGGSGGTPDPGSPPDPGGTGGSTPDPDPGAGGSAGSPQAPYCYGLCLVGVYDSCTCDGSDPCGWANDGYCDDVCAQLLPGASFDDSSDCGAGGGGGGGTPDPGGSGGGGGSPPPADCGTSCNDGIYDSCTCSAADPCGWAIDAYCDDTCYDLSPADHFDDGPDCGGNSGPTPTDPSPGGSDPVPPPAGSNSFAVTSVYDNLDNHDGSVIASGLQSLGYAQYVNDTNVSSASLRSYLAQDITVLYHTGHGNEGVVMTSDGFVGPSGTTINARNSIFATCLTLQQPWASAFGPTAETVMGYTEISFDGIDDDVAEAFVANLGSNHTQLQSWYLANVGVGMLSDRWAAYTRENGGIVEYSARTGNKPMAAMADRSWQEWGENAAVRVDSALLDDTRSFEEIFARGARSMGPSTGVELASATLAGLPPTPLSPDEATAVAQAWLAAHGGVPFDAVVGSVIPLQTREGPSAMPTTIGHVVRYSRVFGNLPVAANGTGHHIALLVGASGVVSDTRLWPDVRLARLSRFHARPMQVAQALRASAPQLATMLKGARVHVVEAVPVFGVRRSSSHARDLEPAYELRTAEGVRVVVSALSGRPLR